MDGSQSLGDTFIFNFKPDGSLEPVASGDITADNERVTVDIAGKLHRARVRAPCASSEAARANSAEPLRFFLVLPRRPSGDADQLLPWQIPSIPKNAEDQSMSASIIKRLTAVAALVAVMVVLLTLSRGTYARGDFASAEVGNVYNLE